VLIVHALYLIALAALRVGQAGDPVGSPDKRIIQHYTLHGTKTTVKSILIFKVLGHRLSAD
jgi:hypothetical protein